MYRGKEEGKKAVENGKSGREEKWLWEVQREETQSASHFHTGVFEHAPHTFTPLLPLSQESFLSLSQSFHPVLNQPTLSKHSGNKGGRSSAFIYFTYDHRLILKTLTCSELRVLLKNSQELLNYFQSMDGENSLLAKIMGVFTVHIRDKAKIHVAVMENVFRDASDAKIVFDIKGSRKNRQCLPPTLFPPSIFSLSPGIYKDLDFSRIQNKPFISNWSEIVFQIEKDTKILRDLNLIDYSLILGVVKNGVLAGKRVGLGAECSVILGVIDYLQEYNVRKRLEKRVKTVINDENAVSVTDPERYRCRFVGFVQGMFETGLGSS